MPEVRDKSLIQINLRVPKDVHKRLKADARKHGKSLNREINDRICDSLLRDTVVDVLEGLRRELGKAA